MSGAMREADGAASQVSDSGRAVATVIGRSFSFRLGAQVVSAFINVAGMVVLGNTLAAEGYGEYAFYYALVPLIASLSDLGIGAIVTRQVARDRSSGARTLGDALLIKGVVSAAFLLGVSATAVLFLDPPHALLLILVTATALIDFSQDVGVWIFRGNDRQDLESLLLIVSQGVWLAGICVCALLKAPLSAFLAAATLAFLLRAGVAAWILIRRFHAPLFHFDRARILKLISEGLPFGLAMFTVVLYGRAGVLLLKGMATTSDVAFFNVAYMLSQPLGFLSSAFNVSAFPSFSRTVAGGTAAARPLLQRAVKFQFLAALPLSVGLLVLAPRIVPLLLKGEDFRTAGLALQVMSAGLALIFLNLMSRYVLTALEAQRAYFQAIVAGLAVNLAVSAALIGSFGAVGACAGLLAGELTVLILCQRALSRWLPAGDLLRELARPLAAALVMGAAIYPLREAPLWVVPAVGAIVYALALLALRALSSDELNVLRGVYVSFKLPGSSFLMRSANRS